VLLIAAQAARSAFVAAEGERRAAAALALWPSHPLPQVTLALASIGAAARQGKPPSPEALEQIRSAGRASPLAVEPLLVAGTERLAAGDRAAAVRFLKAALNREPRSSAAHFLLADLYVREQRIGDALGHVAVLGRRIGGGGAEPFAAALAIYLRDPAKVAEVRPVLLNNPALRNSVMTDLAKDASAAATLRLLTRRGDAGEDWFRIAFERHLAGGSAGEARALLASAGIVGGGTALSPGGSARMSVLWHGSCRQAPTERPRRCRAGPCGWSTMVGAMLHWPSICCFCRLAATAFRRSSPEPFHQPPSNGA
jgi:hypothetical protein